ICYAVSIYHFYPLTSTMSLILLPTGSVAPSSNFRVQYHHFTFFNNHSFNSIDVTGGFSSHLELYLKYASEINGHVLPASVTGFGGKFQFPFEIPFIYRAAIWAEKINSTASDKLVLFPADMTRLGVVASVYTNAIEPTVFLGINKIDKGTRFLGSVGSTYSVNRNYKLGLEFTYGYFGNHDFTSLLSLTSRIFSNLGLQVTGGYISGTSVKRWTVSAGISLTTGAIDFSPRREQETRQIVPSFDDIMKSIDENKEETKENK
ncbi:MAG: hypothetical protein QME58_09530, partial [Bacteroidota bacterium]|nr:hypothetical protein [Bacteroidota bacterium]